MVTVILDTCLMPGAEAAGMRLTRQVWRDMQGFDGCTWRSRADADRIRERYQDSRAIRELTPLLARSRIAW